MSSKVTKRPSVNVKFRNISYTIGQKKILKDVHGEFLTGRLTAILGASGAGKTTLLDVLAGKIHRDVTGTIVVNDKPRNMRNFHKMSSYITQEHLLQPFLTVYESLMTAVNLKLDKDYTVKDKNASIQEISRVMGLEECLETRVEKLSGGERKRLSLALELVNNPPIVFLDEPTTGLDNVTMKNCLELLKSLTLQGRTIICTIHQPSDSIFQLFDQVYFMSEGCCIYDGSVSNLVPFLDSVGLPCPKTYSPADYIIEVVHFNYENTKLLRNRTVMTIQDEHALDISKEDDYSFDYPNSFRHQLWILICRMFVQMSRNKPMLALQFGHHLICGIFLSVMFYQIGNDGKYAAVNAKFFFGIVLYYFFTHVMSPILLYPFEVKLMQNEYFNRWYSLKAYYFALMVTMLPVLVVNAILFTVIIYPLTGQPLEMNRFLWFLTFSILIAISSQGLGYAIGSIFNPTSGACVGSALAIPLVLLSIYGIGYGDQIHPSMKILQSFSFTYHGYVGLMAAILTERDTFKCEEIFCYFGDPQMMLRIMGMQDKACVTEVAFTVFFVVLHRILSYVFLRFRVSHNFVYFTAKYFGQFSYN